MEGPASPIWLASNEPESVVRPESSGPASIQPASDGPLPGPGEFPESVGGVEPLSLGASSTQVFCTHRCWAGQSAVS
jgi:hypothetical protein